VSKKETHTTISSNRLQKELMIGRVGVLGNLGEGKLIENPGSDPKGISWHENCYRAQGEGGSAKPPRHQTRGVRIGVQGARDGARGCKLSEGVPEDVFGIGPNPTEPWGGKMNGETLTSPLNFWTASAYGNPAILAESVSK
jgi:hypothetical protein